MSGVTYVVAVEGLDALRFMDEIPIEIERAAMKAVNKTATRARTAADKRIQAQVAFPASYLRPGKGRLRVARKARIGSLEATIEGRRRATSLAQFTSAKPGGKGQGANGGITVMVKPNVARFLDGAFVIPLRAGLDGGLVNKGVAIRSDVKPDNAYKPKKIGKNVWLLYGPSVGQVLYSARNAASHGSGGAFEDVAPDTAEFLEAEFLRLVELDNL